MPKREPTPAELADLERFHLAYLDEQHEEETRRHERTMRNLAHRREAALRRLAHAEWLALKPPE